MAQTAYLADTNVISQLIKQTPDAGVMQWPQSVELMSISAVTIEEAHFGLAWQPNARKLGLFNAIVQTLHPVYPITESIAQRAPALRDQLQAQGMTRSAPDMIIAAAAQEHQFVIAKRNVRDFVGRGVRVINPFALNA